MFRFNPCPKPEKKVKVKKQYRYARKKTGEYETFLEIAEEREHICFVTGDHVKVFKSNGTLDVNAFAHVCGKGAHVAMRKLKENIVILKPRVHTIYDAGNEKERISMEVYPGWFRLLELHDKLVSEYYNK